MMAAGAKYEITLKFMFLISNWCSVSLGAFFEALIQRTDGCTNFLWLLVSHRGRTSYSLRITEIVLFKRSNMQSHVN